MSHTTFSILDNDAAENSASERIADSMHRTVDRVANRARGVEHDLRLRIAALRGEAREQEQRARAMLSTNVENALAYARKKPLVAVGIAFAAGAAIYGLLVRR